MKAAGLFEQFKPYAIKLANSTVEDLQRSFPNNRVDREDIFQDMYVKLWEIVQKVSDKFSEGERTNFITIALNNYAKDIKRNFYKKAITLEELKKESLISDVFEEKDKEILVEDLKKKLERSRKIRFKTIEKEVVLEMLKGKKLSEISKEKKVSRATTYRAYNSAVRKLKEIYAGGRK